MAKFTTFLILFGNSPIFKPFHFHQNGDPQTSFPTQEEKMNAYSVGNYVPSDFAIKLEPAEGSNVPTSAGTFMLRRALYFSQSINALLTGEHFTKPIKTLEEVEH